MSPQKQIFFFKTENTTRLTKQLDMNLKEVSLLWNYPKSNYILEKKETELL